MQRSQVKINPPTGAGTSRVGSPLAPRGARGHVAGCRRQPRRGVSCGAAVPADAMWMDETNPEMTRVVGNVCEFGDTVDDRVLNRCRALVLDVSCRPVGVLSWKRALCLDILEKVDVLEYYDVSIRSLSTLHPLPAVLRARFLLKTSKDLSVPISKRNILVRDQGRCGYCGTRHNLTVDHIIPLSKGGPTTWENVVTACEKCNSKKGNKTLKQLGWKLRTKPHVPSAYNPAYHTGLPTVRPAEWEDYLAHFSKL